MMCEPYHRRNEFIQTYSEVLKKFRITGTQTTMRMCKSYWGEGKLAIYYMLDLGRPCDYLDIIAHSTHNFSVC